MLKIIFYPYVLLLAFLTHANEGKELVSVIKAEYGKNRFCETRFLKESVEELLGKNQNDEGLLVTSGNQLLLFQKESFQTSVLLYSGKKTYIITLADTLNLDKYASWQTYDISQVIKLKSSASVAVFSNLLLGQGNIKVLRKETNPSGGTNYFLNLNDPLLSSVRVLVEEKKLKEIYYEDDLKNKFTYRLGSKLCRNRKLSDQKIFNYKPGPSVKVNEL